MAQVARILAGCLASVAFVAASAPLYGRQQPPPPGTGSIAGVVVDNATSQPIRHARVDLVTVRQGLVKGINADEAGRFRFDRIASGSYLLYVSALRYPRVEYGAATPGASGRVIAVADGASVSDLTVRLSRGGVITGKISSQTGEPLIDVSVFLWQWGPAVENGNRPVVRLPMGSQPTDDRGIYRLYDVPPGDYFVATSAERELMDGPGPDRSGESLPVVAHEDVETLLRGGPAVPPRPASHTRHVQTFHPSALGGSEAALVSVAAAEERTGIDITVRTVTTATIGGTLVKPAGVAASGPVVRLINVTKRQGVESSFEGMSRLDNDTFTFKNIAPGDYVVSVAWGGMFASMPVSVEGHDILNLVLTPRPGLTVSGRVRYESASPPTGTGLRVGLRAVLAPDQISFSAPSPIDNAGRFSVSDVTPGQYVVSVSPSSSADDKKWWMKSALVNGRDAADSPIDLNADLADIVVTLSDRPASVSGTLHTANGDTARGWAIIFAADRGFWLPHSRRIAATRSLPDGTYRIGNLPAGEYFIAAVANATTDQWFDPAFLDRLASGGALRIVVADGEQKAQDLKIGG